jgi:hypothetical protein
MEPNLAPIIYGGMIGFVIASHRNKNQVGRSIRRGGFIRKQCKATKSPNKNPPTPRANNRPHHPHKLRIIDWINDFDQSGYSLIAFNTRINVR